ARHPRSSPTRRSSDLDKRVREALDRGEFFLQYQPEIDLATGKLAAVEALLRWRDPDSGVVMPPDFLPLVEENGAIIPIGQWVLRSEEHTSELQSLTNL